MEYFHRRDHVPKLLSKYGLVGNRVPAGTIEDYIAALKRYRTTPNGYFGFKAHRGQYKWLIEHCDLERCFAGLQYVYIARNDTLAQAVSVSKAVQTRRWTSGERSIGEPEYNEHHISYCLRTIQKSNRYWRKLFKERGISPVNVIYEELAADKQEILEKVLTHLGAAGVAVPPSEVSATLEKQFDSVNQEWIDRYRSTHDTGAPS